MPESPLGASIRVLKKAEKVSLQQEFIFKRERQLMNRHT